MLHTVSVTDKKYLFFRHSLVMFNYNQDVLNMVDHIEQNRDEDNPGTRQMRSYLAQEAEIKRKIDVFLTNYAQQDLDISGCDINVFYGCNLACKYCFASGGNHGKQGMMTKEKAREVIDYIMEHSGDRQQIRVTVIGGEPLLNPGVFREIVSYGYSEAAKRDKKIGFATTTNGTLLNEQAVEMLHQNSVAYIISLDSHEQKVNDYLRVNRNGKSTYDMIMGNWDTVRKKGIIRVNVTVTPYNMNLSDIARHLFAQGASHIHFAEVKSDDEQMQFNAEQIEQLKYEYDKLADLLLEKLAQGEQVGCYPLLKDLYKLHTRKPVIQVCSTLNRRVAFSPDGKIYPCDMLMWDKYCLGDIERGTNPEIINRLKQNISDEGECASCWARYLCGGECLADKLWENQEQRRMRCELKRHIFSLKLYIYDYLVNHVKNFEFRKY